ncbi:hypothetical protein BY996DRAFT_4151637 [Phakopsora pachyrhizi]|nr:hypothetical protein BY996DRAFT_4151509 [Phakopsora pachyrhizi]KAI8450567.1 hypothetical protein BY996DRAFT_4151637 [Phakopsora pachyrhizi]
MILRDFDKLFGRISQDFYLNLYFNKSLPLVFDIIDWLALNELDNGILLEKLLVNEKFIEGLDFYISSRIILDGGYIEIFKADDIQSYLLKHQNLEEIRNLLNCLEKNHWKRVELGFIKVHLSPSFNIKINDSLMATNTVIGFEEIFKSMEKAHSFNSEWLKVLSMDKETKSAPLFFVEKVFVLHTLRYCKKYFENFNLDSIMEQKVEFFTKSYSLFRRQLIMHEELEDSEYVRTVEFPKNLSVIKHVLSLRKLAINKKPSITEVRLDGISVVFAKALRCMDKSWISRYIWKCNNLILSEQEMLFLNVSAWISSSDEKFTSWLNSKPLQDFYNEVLAINKSYTALGGFLK